MRIIVDLVPNHSSDQHEWFQTALKAGPGSPERERYLFRDGRGEGGAEPPNNWDSVFGGSAWTRVTDPATGGPEQWYLHMFDTTQPDFNWDHPEVREEFHDVLRFWCERGVDGFRVDVAHGLVKKAGLPDWAGTVAMVDGVDGDGETIEAADHVGDEPRVVTGTTSANGVETSGDAKANDGDVNRSGSGVISGETAPMFDQEGVHENYEGWRRVLDEFNAPGEQYSRALVAEAWVEPQSRLARYVRPTEMQQAFNFPFLVTLWDAAAYRDVITESLESLGAVGAPATWVLSNHDVVRHPSRFGLSTPGLRPPGIAADHEQPDHGIGLRRGRAATAFMLALPGSAYIYQGEELGLPEHTTLPHEVRQDPAFFRTRGTPNAETGRDGCRVPMPWEADAPAFGFSPTGASWLPQPAEWATLAVDAQTGDATSTLEFYRTAIALRRELGLGAGGLRWLDGYGDDMLAFQITPGRGFEKAFECVCVVVNLGDKPVDLARPNCEVILSSATDGPRVGDTGAGKLPGNTTVWLKG